MVRTQVYLTDEQKQALETVSRRTGQSQSELIRDAIDCLVESQRTENPLRAASAAFGIWKDRTDLPDFRALRTEWGRRAHPLEPDDDR